MNKFKPMLASNEQIDLEKIKYPKLASYKLDGIRCVFHPELGMVSRSLKPIKNKQLNEKFQFMVNRAKKYQIIFDGELYGHGLSFQSVTRAVMTEDFNDEKTIKKIMKSENMNVEQYNIYVKLLIDNIKFHCFEAYRDGEDDFTERVKIYNLIDDSRVYCVPQIVVTNPEQVEEMFEQALDDGYEGLILRDPHSPYKFGRSTLKEEYMLKVKPYKTFDAKIIGVVQATVVDPNAEKKINELGRSVTSKKKDDRILIEKASAFEVEYGEHRLKVSLAMTDEEKEEVWKNQKSYIGRMIEYKGMMIGAKDVPRHPVFLRFREDRD